MKKKLIKEICENMSRNSFVSIGLKNDLCLSTCLFELLNVCLKNKRKERRHTTSILVWSGYMHAIFHTMLMTNRRMLMKDVRK